MSNVITMKLTRDSASSITVLKSNPLFLGRFNAAERESILDKFHNQGISVSRLAYENKVGDSLIEALIRTPTKPMAHARANDRRQVKQVKVAA